MPVAWDDGADHYDGSLHWDGNFWIQVPQRGETSAFIWDGGFFWDAPSLDWDDTTAAIWSSATD